MNTNDQIKNIIFDIGNVLVKWSPKTIIANTFDVSHDHDKLLLQIFKHNLWKQLNKGEFTEVTARKLYQDHLNLSEDTINLLFNNIKTSLDLINETADLLEKLYSANYQLYALTDNVREIVTFLKEKYNFWQYFSGIVVSADVGCLKPSPEIYQHLLTNYYLQPSESVFIDDIQANVAGAQAQGMHGIQFSNAKQCKVALQNLGILI